MRALYYIFFCIGIVYTAITLILGGILDGFDVGGDGVFEGVFTAFKPTVIISFLTVFGGVGLMTYRHFPWYGSLIISLLPATAVSCIIDRLIIAPLYRAQNTSAPEKHELVGIEGIIISAILENGFGTVAYSFRGNTYNSPARSLKGERIEQGKTVVITSIEDSVFYVMEK